MSGQVFDRRACELGEGPLWHPAQGVLFWFDILGKRLMAHSSGEEHELQFDEYVSAAGWTGEESLLIASESQLFELDIPTGKEQKICDLEADNPATRSNDGRADRHGGFWIGNDGETGRAEGGRHLSLLQGRVAQALYRRHHPQWDLLRARGRPRLFH